MWMPVAFTTLSLLCNIPTFSEQTNVGAEPSVIQINSQIKKESSSSVHNISIVGDEFMLDGQPLHIVSGSLHYFRLPAEYWRDRLRKLKAAGLNSVATYVEWSYHEPEEREYKFDGDRDIARFVRLAAEEGLHVLLRPGPYICAERDLGGFPYWILGKYPNIKLRTTDKDFIEETKIWMNKLFEQLGPLLFGNGGPIILVQVENEYGSYGRDQAYKEKIRDIIGEHVGNNALLYTTDGAARSFFVAGSVPGALTTIDFGSNTDVKAPFRELRKYMPTGPLMNSEYYPGWLTHWGETLQQVDTEAVVKTLRDMLDNKINVNFYMFFGGTNFEFTAGANYFTHYASDITSYDYDAPLSEAGDPTSKYYAIRDALKQFNFEAKDILKPEPSKKGQYGPLTVAARVGLLTLEGRSMFGKTYKDVSGSTLPTFEHLRQRSGLVLYETILNDANGILQIEKPRDRIYVFVNNVYAGIISRIGSNMMQLICESNSTLSLLVENQGRINFGHMLHDFKGILSPVYYMGKTLNGKWSITGYPLEVLPSLNDKSIQQQDAKSTPLIYEGNFTLPPGEQPLDTFIDFTGWGKGYIWVNGHNLGRYWPAVGPQVTLYLPGVWLHPAPASNHLVILELEEASPPPNIQSIEYPILNRTGAIY